MKDTFVSKLGTKGIAGLQERRWYMTRYDGKEALRSNIGFLMGKNPNHGFSIDYELRISNHLSDKMQHRNKSQCGPMQLQDHWWPESSSVWNHSRPIFSQDNHSSNQKSKTCERPPYFSQSRQESRSSLQHSHPECQIYSWNVHGNSNHRNLLNWSWPFETRTPGKSSQYPNSYWPRKYPSVWTIRKVYGHYCTPLSCIAVVKTHVEILLSQNPSLYLDDKFPTGPMLQERRWAPIQGPDDKNNNSNSLVDPYGDMSVASVGSSKASTSNVPQS